MSTHNKTIQELLSDPSFVKWVKYPDQENNLRWENWCKKNPKKKNDLLLAREILLRMNFNEKFPTEAEVQNSFNEISAEVSHSKAYSSLPTKNKWLFLKLAAAFSVLVLATFIIIHLQSEETATENLADQPIEMIKRENPLGQKTRFSLPDGSFVWLNSHSKIIYPLNFIQNRKVQLVGEAFFEVKEDTLYPFEVEAQLAEISVLGTTFNVNAYEENVAITLLNGKLAVSLSDSDTSSLVLPGEQVIVNKQSGLIQNQKFDSLAVYGWTNGWLVFNNAGINEIKTKLRRWYGVNIKTVNEPNEDWRINGYFQNQSLEMVLDRLAFSKNFEYKIMDKDVTIYFN